MQLAFTKMQGLGNDFIVIDAIHQEIEAYLVPDNLKKLADRHFGIGCDQFLIVEKPLEAHNDFCYRIFNADGSEVEQCGNGARCFARFVYDKKLTTKTTLRVETKKGVIIPRIEADGQVTVDMGTPHFLPTALPFLAPNPALTYSIEVNETTQTISTVSMGNPHAVLVVPENLWDQNITELGAAIESHPRFPERVNVGFMQVISPNAIQLRVYERGAGETLACGTGACAAAVTAKRLGLVDPVHPIQVTMRGGTLSIQWNAHAEHHSVFMTGPAITVFEGSITL